MLRFIAIFACCVASYASAADVTPYFMNIKAKEANIRVAASTKFGISYKYVRNNIPVQVIAKQEHWRKIRDIDGSIGWIHKALLNKKRTVFIIGDTDQLLTNNGDVIAKIETGVVAEIISCSQLSCHVKILDKELKGYLPKNSLWGVMTSKSE